MALQAVHNKTTFGIGDLIKVYYKILEGNKIRVQPFEGIVLSIKGEGEKKMFTVRRIGEGGIGIERIIPLSSPWIEKIEVKQKAVKGVRRAKLYYLRKTGKREHERLLKRASRKKAVNKTANEE